MQRGHYLAMHLAAGLAALTGFVYGWMRYIVRPADEFAAVNHPWQPLVQHLHVLLVPGLVLMLGVLWSAHAVQHWRAGTREGRRTGAAAWWSALPMIVSGYALQVSVAETARQVWIVTHVATSLCWTVGYIGHFLAHRCSDRAREERAQTRAD